jgi:hypothetical protein
MRFEFHPEAFEEYLQATSWYTERDPSIALAFVESVEAPFSESSTRPSAGESSMKTSDDASLACFLTPFSTQSKATKATVLIVAVMHCSRELDYWRARINRG